MKPLDYVLVAALAGCVESEYVYTPETANAVTHGMPAAHSAIPPERPQGSVELVSGGITTLHPRGARVDVLHVRMIVANDGDDTPWQLDTRRQFVAIDGVGRSRAMYVEADGHVPAIVTIPRHERRALDFYFPLPATMRRESKLPHFVVQWEVETASREVAQSTVFDRVEGEPINYFASSGTYWGPG